jgi:hypothetical protein
MADRNGRAVILDPRRNQTIERKKLFEEMLLKEMPGIWNCRVEYIYLLYNCTTIHKRLSFINCMIDTIKERKKNVV